VLGGEFVCALYFPWHKVIVCNYTCNDHLVVDIHGLAQSPSDKTPAVPHLVLTEEDATALSNYYKMEDTPIPYISNEMFQHYEVDGVEMPEDRNFTQAWDVQYAELLQKEKYHHRKAEWPDSCFVGQACWLPSSILEKVAKEGRPSDYVWRFSIRR